MKKLLWLIVGLVLTIGCRGAGVSVKAAADWVPLSEAQMAALANRGGGRLLDASKYSSGGGASLFSFPATREVDKQFADESVAGFIEGLSGTGQKVLRRSPALVGSLPGVCVETEGKVNGQETGIISYMLFAQREVYTISLYGRVGISQSDPLVASYLSRLKIEPALIAGDIEKLSPFELGRRAGHLGVRIMMAGAGLIAVVVVVVQLIKRRKATRPPPLPLRAGTAPSQIDPT